jgi:hypothetical protein
VLALWLAGILLGSAAAQAPPAATHKPTQHALGEMPASAREHYALAWGVDEMAVRLAESGQLVRFSYRVVDAAKAKPLHEKSSSPYLLDEQVHAVLQVPTMEKVGPLRQTTPPEPGKSYWMVFSNKGFFVKAGHRVSVTIGRFRADGLIVR